MNARLMCFGLLLLACVAPAVAENEGQPDLDKALELKLTSESLRDLNQVVELLDEAIEKGLDADNTDLAEQMLVASLTERATALASVVLGQPLTDPRRDPRWVQVRQVALSDLQRVVNLDEDQPAAHLLIGRLQSLPLGDPSAARRALTQAIKTSESAGDSGMGLEAEELAQAYALRGATQADVERRLADFDKAITIEPEKVEYVLLRAKHYFATQEFDACLKDIDAAVAMAPENFAVHELKALVLLAQEKPEAALESFNKASELEPDAVSPYQYRGEVFSRLGDLDKAIEQLNKAVQLAPENVASLLIRAELLALNDQNEQALGDIDQVLAKQPGLVRALLMRARLLGQMERKDESIEALEKLAEAAGNNPEVRLQLAAAYADQSRYTKAIEQLDRVLELAPGTPIALRLRGDMYLSVGKHAEALKDFESSLAESPDDSGVLNNFAWTLATSPFDELRDGKRALEMATKAAEITEFNQAHILSTLAAAYAEMGEYDKAIEWSQKAIDMDREKNEGKLEGALSQELTNYKSKTPYRELKNDDVDAAGAQEAAPPASDSSKDATPARTIDF
ncbi:lipoprotein NlpI [Pirellulimonas nuda]|uniref:Lipoprotein NlpI n=1 Tax=Pirellulimonas nuda TaxID=2528009 RepID=A0A518DIJ8_9BACT|nr:tetratricopeptide repeat protein [Pirellulimonas nuda]QDU91252.1 lipoprotein NlpI [Pirellulimonas nuda]